jgi:putative IMPACT (imprinted ancient) family translation regulator
MLMALSHSGVGDICAVVTRYFGGKLLGKGGLVKAYSGGVQAAVTQLPTKEKIARVSVSVIFDYANITPIQRILPDFEIEVIEEEYGVDVTYQIKLPEERFDPFAKAITDLTKGQAILEVLG